MTQAHMMHAKMAAMYSASAARQTPTLPAGLPTSLPAGMPPSPHLPSPLSAPLPPHLHDVYRSLHSGAPPVVKEEVDASSKVGRQVSPLNPAPTPPSSASPPAASSVPADSTTTHLPMALRYPHSLQTVL